MFTQYNDLFLSVCLILVTFFYECWSYRHYFEQWHTHCANMCIKIVWMSTFCLDSVLFFNGVVNETEIDDCWCCQFIYLLVQCPPLFTPLHCLQRRVCSFDDRVIFSEDNSMYSPTNESWETHSNSIGFGQSSHTSFLTFRAPD